MSEQHLEKLDHINICKQLVKFHDAIQLKRNRLTCLDLYFNPDQIINLQFKQSVQQKKSYFEEKKNYANTLKQKSN